MNKKSVISELSYLSNAGFTAVVQSSQKFNVICITKKSLDDEHFAFHLPPDGGPKNNGVDERAESVEIEVKQVQYTRNDISVTQTVVTYKGKDYVLKYIGNGLSGSSLVIGIYNEDEVLYGVWDLYTDTPSAKPDRPDEVVTSEELRARAKTAMGWPEYKK